jgi:hypothetical protein
MGGDEARSPGAELRTTRAGPITVAVMPGFLTGSAAFVGGSVYAPCFRQLPRGLGPAVLRVEPGGEEARFIELPFMMSAPPTPDGRPDLVFELEEVLGDILVLRLSAGGVRNCFFTIRPPGDRFSALTLNGGETPIEARRMRELPAVRLGYATAAHIWPERTGKIRLETYDYRYGGPYGVSAELRDLACARSNQRPLKPAARPFTAAGELRLTCDGDELSIPGARRAVTNATQSQERLRRWPRWEVLGGARWSDGGRSVLAVTLHVGCDVLLIR